MSAFLSQAPLELAKVIFLQFRKTSHAQMNIEGYNQIKSHLLHDFSMIGLKAFFGFNQRHWVLSVYNFTVDPLSLFPHYLTIKQV